MSELPPRPPAGRPARARARGPRALGASTTPSPSPWTRATAAHGEPRGPSTRVRRPPTACPGTHHVEARVFKDLFPRFRTMQGYHVERKAGWDCHGLPVELAVEKELGFSGKGDIEAYGVAEFNAKCRESVLRNVDLFEAMTERMGYWVDLAHPYTTMALEYVESVWWALKQIHDKGLLVEDYRVAPYCPRCGTGLSDHELAQGYETVTDPSVYVRFPLTSGPYAGKASLLVWTTTPWTLVSNTAVAVNPDVDYVVVTDGERDPRRRRAAARRRCSARAGRSSRPCPAAEMERWEYDRPFELVDFPRRAGRRRPLALRGARRLRHHRGRHRPGAPVPRLRRGRHARVPRATGCRWSTRSRPTATSRTTSPLVGGQFFKHADTDLVRDLDARGLLFRHVAYEHSYPHCWRCHTALLYYAQPSWYVRTTPRKDELLRENEAHELVPRDRQVRPLRRLARQQHRLGAVAAALLGHAPADLALRGGPPGLRRLAGRARRADRHRPVRARPAPAVRRRRHLRLPDLRRDRPTAGARRHRRLVRQRLDAVRPVGLPARRGLGGAVRAGLPRGLHLRGDRPDPRLVLHADGGQHAGLRPELVRERRLPRPHPGRGRPEDVQAPGQHPRADPADGRARRRRGALVHGRLRLAVGGAPGRAHRAAGDRPQGAADLLEHRGVPGALRAHRRLVARRPGTRGRGPPGAGPVGAVRGAPAGPAGHRGAGGLRHPAHRRAARRRTSTTCPTGTSGARAAGSGTATRPRWRPCTSACTS